MTLSMRIAPHLPYLRRFARAVTGSQAEGDGRVAELLEALIADISSFPAASSDRIGLYQMFAARFSKAPKTTLPPPGSADWEARAAQHLSKLTPLAKQAFLLIAVEGFTKPETSEILGIEPTAVDGLLREAGQDISRQVATEILIIEDEPLIAMDIEHMVESLGHRVVGVARTHREAVLLARRNTPRLILADIQLADGSSGIDAVNELLTSHPVPVIFITAFPERLLTGERPEPTYLVTKPFNPDMVKALISQALFFDDGSKEAA